MFSIKKIDIIYATIALLTLCTFLFFEGAPTSSPIKLAVMGLAPAVFLFRAPIVTPALICGMGYWVWCYFSSLFNGEQRFSTLGFLGMYLITFIAYFNLLQKGTFTFLYFKKLIRGLIMAFGIILVMQQICMLAGIHNMPIFNLHNQFFLSLTKLHSLTLEPSHSARVLAALALSYWRLYELENSEKPTLRALFKGEMKWPMILFFWSMLTMGSGTAFIALGILSLYFITKQTVAYVVPFIVAMYFTAGAMQLTQFERASTVAQAAMTGDAEQVQQADGSAATRVMPLVNTLTKTDLTLAETWIGKGTAKIDKRWWMKTDTKLGVIDQFGMIGFIITMVLMFTCIIRRFWSIETLLTLGLLALGIGNIYYSWGIYLAFAGVTYFQKQNELGMLEIEEEEEEEGDDDDKIYNGNND